MSRTRLAAGFAVAVCVGVAVAVAAGPPTPAPRPAPSYRDEPIAPARVVGSPSCSAASCHGGTGAKGSAGSEHSTFADYDPHRRAFQVLYNEGSKRMVELLAAGEAATPAHRNDLCLKCHGATPPNADAPLPAASELHRGQGSCESCHGAAGNWLTEHYTGQWKTLTASQKAAHGLLPTKDLAFRVQLCAGCHVGEPGRDVDHRLIAAGHPALRFEFAAFQAEPVYAKHWKEKPYGRDVEAWTWLIGQVGTARAQADLTRHRAASAGQSGHDWPEFAEYSCFSCHQSLAPTGPRQRVRGETRHGAAPWGSWAFPMTLELAKRPGPGWSDAPQGTDGVADLAELFRKYDRPNPALAAEKAGAAVADLDSWLIGLQATAERRSRSDPLSPVELRSSLRDIFEFAEGVDGRGAPGTDWDRSTQAFLGAAALYRSLCVADPAERSGATESVLRANAEALRFAPGTEGPRQWTDKEAASFYARWIGLRHRVERRLRFDAPKPNDVP